MDKYALKDSRYLFGLTAKEMALKLKTPLRTYEGWEQGRSIPGVVEVAVALFDLNMARTLVINST